MNKVKSIGMCLSICIITIATLVWISTWKNIKVTKAEFITESEHRLITLPFSEDFVGSYWVKVELQNITKKSYQFRITPDDEIVALKLNGQSVSLDDISKDDKRNYSSGFLFTFNDFIPEKKNILEFQLTNSSNPTGFNIQSMQRFNTQQLIAIIFTLILFSLFLTRYLRITHLQKLFLILSLIMSVIYLAKTDPRTRTFDVYEGGGHKDYIDYLIDNHTFPDPGKGWEYHQPPLYYLIAAAAKQAAHIDKTSSDLWGQLIALFFWSIFLTSSLACLRLGFIKQLWPLAIASFTLCFWPSGIIHSIRIGNDLALYAFFGLSFFYTIKWWRARQTTQLFWASLWMAAAIITKSNGLAIAATIGILFCIQLYNYAQRANQFSIYKSKLIKEMLIIGGFFFIALVLNFGDNVYYYLIGNSHDWLLSNVGTTINSGLKVNNNVSNYVVFDLATYLQNPFISTWEDIYGRQYFWNFVWRSALTSEFRFEGELATVWGISNGIFLLSMLLGAVIYGLQRQPTIHALHFKRQLYKNLPWLLSLIFLFVLLLAYRIKAPLSCNTDFRYIYPVIVSILFFTALAWRQPRKYPIPAVLTLGGALIGLSSILWVIIFK